MFGLPQGAIDDLNISQNNVDFFYWQENEETLSAFLLLQTQWKYAAMGGTIGLDYNAVEIVLKRHNFKSADKIFQELQMMEFAVLPIVNKNGN